MMINFQIIKFFKLLTLLTLILNPFKPLKSKVRIIKILISFSNYLNISINFAIFQFKILKNN